MSQSLAALAALESLPQPHLQVLCGTTSHGVNADGHDCVLQADLGVQTSLSTEPPRWTFLLTPALEALLRQEPQWRLYLRAKSLAGADSGISLHVVRNEDLAGLRMSSASIAVAAILQASPIQQPWYIGARSQLPCAEMVAESAGIRGRGLLEVASADKAAAAPPFGLFCDGWWEAVLQDPRPKSDEALFLEDVIIAVRVPTNEAGARLSLRAFCCLTRSADAEPHPLSPPALLDCALAPGLHLLRSPVGRRSRYLRISMSGSVVLLGVEAFCAELLPPSGTLRQCLARVVRAYAPQPAVAVRAGEGFQKFSYSALWSDVECFSSAMRSRYDLDTKVAQDEDVVIAWIGSTCLEAFFCFLACMANQWCFMALGSSQLAALSVALPTLTVGEQPSELKVPHLPSAEVGELVRQGRRLPEGPQASLRRSASMIFTSGSTGTPKAIRRDHEELYSFLWLYAKAATPDSPCHLAYQPYSHMNEQLGTAAAFLQGSCLAFSSAQTAYADARIVEPTGIQGVPRFFEPLLSVYESKEATLEELRLSFGGRLHSLTTGSAPVTKRLFDFLRLCFESCSCSVTNSYGATEVGPIAHNGRVNPNVEVKIVPLAALGHDPGGFTGEVRVRCKNTRVQAQAYVGATLALDEDGFYCTGDIGCYKDDFLELLGRVGNVAKMANGLFLSAEGLEEKYDRTAALQAAQARAQDLEEELAGTEAELATAATELQRLEKEEVERATEIEDARQKLSEVQMEIETMQARAQTSRVDDLEATSRALAESLQKAGQERTAAREKQEALKSELRESESDLKKAEAEVASLTGELEKAQSEAESLTEQVDNLLQSSSGDKSKAETLQKSVEANNKELDATRGLLATRQLEVEALHQVLDNENQSHRQELEALEAAAEASTQSSQELAQQLRELERRRDEAADALAAAESHKLAVEQEIQKVIAETEKVTKETCTSLSLLKAQTPQTYAQGAEQKPDDPEAVTLRQLKQQVEAEAQRVANLRSDLAAREVEVERQASIAAALAPAGGVSELEGSLQQMNMELVRAQESARKSRRQEEDLRNDLAKLKERTAATRDKLLYQEDHLKLQGETLAKLESQKAKSEGDVETLTLGLHKLDQENQYLQEAIKHLMQQVEAKHGGSLDGWAGESCEAQVAREVARYAAEIEQWKRQTEQVRRQKTGEVTRQYQQHEVTVQTLNQRIDKLQKEIIQCDRCAKSWEEEKSRRTNSAPTSPTVLPGLVIFQRPLPSHHERRKALLIGVNYSNSHAPLKGCVNDVWNMQCLLRYTLRYTPEQLQLLVDGADGQSRPDRAPTKANILAGLQWLIEDVRPGDHLLLVFSGYGAQHPRTPGSNKCESYLVPSDFAADLPSDFFEVVASACKGPAQPNVIDQTAKMATGAAPGGPEEIERQAAAAQKALGSSKASYRLVSMLEVHDFLSQLPQRCRVSLLLDACYTILPGAGPESNSPATFRKVDRGRVEYDKLRDFMSRPRFLELPPLPVQHTPPHLPRSNSFLPCTLHCFSGCRLKEWCAEFPIEGSVQGAFSWAFLKALAQGHFHIGVYQFQQLVSNILLNLKGYFRHIDQQPVLQLSAAASAQDVVLWT